MYVHRSKHVERTDLQTDVTTYMQQQRSYSCSWARATLRESAQQREIVAAVATHPQSALCQHNHDDTQTRCSVCSTYAMNGNVSAETKVHECVIQPAVTSPHGSSAAVDS